MFFIKKSVEIRIRGDSECVPFIAELKSIQQADCMIH